MLKSTTAFLMFGHSCPLESVLTAQSSS